MLYARQNQLALDELLPLRSQERYRREPGFWTIPIQQYDALGNKSNAEQICGMPIARIVSKKY